MSSSTWVYDCAVWFFTLVVSLFFREIKQRGAHKIPKSGPVIFVAAPHANQFVDPLILLRECKRRIGFLCAAKTMDRKYVGKFAKAVNSIPVARAHDMAKRGEGRIRVEDRTNAPLTILGVGTKFLTQLKVRDSIALPGNAASAEVVEIVSDTELVVKTNMTKDLKALELLSSSEGTTYKCVPYVDQADMYRTVYDRLNAGECIGIFPEGGSHDRYEMLPLKAGVCIMALGAMAEHPGLDVKIVPCGLNYFHPHKFRSRAVVEFADPITIDKELVDKYIAGGPMKREACGKLLEVIYQALKTVTVNAGDYETLMVIQAGRRLYRPSNRRLSTSKVLELNRRFVAAYQLFKDKPEVQSTKEKVMVYNKMLKYHALRDHQVKKTEVGGGRALALLIYRTMSLSTMAMLALPGAVLNAPIGLIARIISNRKAKEALAASTVKIAGRDVLATWKLMVALVLIPLFYWFYAFVALFIVSRYDVSFTVKLATPFVTLSLLPFVSYASLRFGETSLDIFRSLRPLFLSVFPGSAPKVRNLRQLRDDLSKDLTTLIDQYAPGIFPDFEAKRVIPKEIDVTQANEAVTSPGGSALQWIYSIPGAVSSYAFSPILGDSIFNWSDIGNDDAADDVFFFHNDDEDAGGGENGSISGTSTPRSRGRSRSRSSSVGEGLCITAISMSALDGSEKSSSRPRRSRSNRRKEGDGSNGSAKATGVESNFLNEQNVVHRAHPRHTTS